MLERWKYVNQTDEMEPVPSESNYFNAMADMATQLKMSASVIAGIRAEHYDLDQINMLIAQKEHLNACIRQAEHPSEENTPPSLGATLRSHDPDTSIISSAGAKAAPAVKAVGSSFTEMLGTAAGTPTNTPADSTTATPTKTQGKISASTRTVCRSKICHTCRPFFQDRVCMNLESVLKGEQPAITEDEITHLPFLDPAVVRKLGLRMSPEPRRQYDRQSVDITDSYDGGAGNESPSSDDWTPTSKSSSEYDEDNEHSGDPYPCPGAGVCPLYSRQSGCAYDYGFDDGMRAVSHGYMTEHEWRSQIDEQLTPERSNYHLRRMKDSVSDTPGGTSSTASSISLPTPTTLPLRPIDDLQEAFDEGLAMRFGSKTGKAATICGVMTDSSARSRRYGQRMTGKDSNSSLGSEIEVEGGVALTEEAVETGVPDIITTDSADMR